LRLIGLENGSHHHHQAINVPTAGEQAQKMVLGQKKRTVAFLTELNRALKFCFSSLHTPSKMVRIS
jgi:hypothetical protein